jgi:hypothetical protein
MAPAPVQHRVIPVNEHFMHVRRGQTAYIQWFLEQYPDSGQVATCLFREYQIKLEQLELAKKYTSTVKQTEDVVLAGLGRAVAVSKKTLDEFCANNSEEKVKASYNEQLKVNTHIIQQIHMPAYANCDVSAIHKHSEDMRVQTEKKWTEVQNKIQALEEQLKQAVTNLEKTNALLKCARGIKSLQQGIPGRARMPPPSSSNKRKALPLIGSASASGSGSSTKKKGKMQKAPVKEGFAVTRCMDRIQVRENASEEEFLAAWKQPVHVTEKAPTHAPVFLPPEQVTELSVHTKNTLASELATARTIPDLNVKYDNFCVCAKCAQKQKDNQPTDPQHGKNFSIKKRTIVVCIDQDTKEQRVLADTSEYKNPPSKKPNGPAPCGVAPSNECARRSYPNGPVLGRARNNLERMMLEANMSPFPNFSRSPGGPLPTTDGLKKSSDLLSDESYWEANFKRKMEALGVKEAKKQISAEKKVLRDKITNHYGALGEKDGFLNQHVAFKSSDGKVHLLIPAECYYPDIDPATAFGTEFADFSYACVVPQRDRMKRDVAKHLLGEDAVSATPDHAYVVSEKGIPTIRFSFPGLWYADEQSSARKNDQNSDSDDE